MLSPVRAQVSLKMEIYIKKECSELISNYLYYLPGNDNLLQAFVQFLEQESQPQTNAQTRPTLLSMGKQVEASPATSVPAAIPIEATVGTAASMATTPAAAAAGAAVGGEQTGARSTTATPPTPPMQSLLMNSNEFVPTRNSSSILKDILNDS